MAGSVNDYGKMEDIARLLDQTQSDIQGMNVNMNSQVAALVSDGFSTPQASTAFQESYDQYTQASIRALETMGSCALWLRNYVSNQQQMDQSAASQIRF